MKLKRGQVTIFVIIGILIVGAVIFAFTYKNSVVPQQMPASVEPVYNSFLSCLEEDTLVGVNVLESQGGYIQMPAFEPGSSYSPFSSQLEFLGNPIPYWYYISGNNIAKEQVPSVGDMQTELETFIEGRIRNCAFDSYYAKGFEIDQGTPKADVQIKDEKILVSLNMPLNITQFNESFIISTHNIEVSSKLKKLYDSALELYSKEQKEMFLENYTVDVLRNYAPVDGVELTCSPLTWNAGEVFTQLQKAIEANILALKTKGGDFSLTKPENKYFIVNTNINARFINSKNWTSSFEVNPSKGALLIAEPVGNQAGLGILGFCYVPYHFVYNIKYPVLVQVYEDQEFFQFPFAVVLQGNVPRTPISGPLFETEEIPEICAYKNTNTIVQVTDKRSNNINANVSYECSGVSCEMGKTVGGVLETLFPQCVNGNLIISSGGFRTKTVPHTILEEGEVSVFLEKLSQKDVSLKIDSKDYSGQAVITFTSADDSTTIVYPSQKKVNLSEGQYEVQVYVYENSSLTIPASTQQQCIDVPQSGLGSVFGLTEQKCFDYQIPSQILSNALSGGGKENYYVLESELEDSKSIEINAESLPRPGSLEQLQTNYVLFESKRLDVSFK